MEKIDFGKTGLKITCLGLGLAEISRQERSKVVAEADRVLNVALDNGINFLDTASCYGTTEELIGNTVAHRREEYILATKCGHVTDDGEAGGLPWTDQKPWTAPAVSGGINRSLRRLKTDHLDLVQLHSCDVDVLERGEVIEALVKAQEAGKTRFIGYSGDNEAARWAVNTGLFDTLQTSFNLVEQHARTKELFTLAEAKGMGIIIKRPIANGVWGKAHSPYPYADEYFRRAQIMAQMGPLPGAPEDPILLAMGFVLAQSEVDTVIVGTHNPSHVLSNIEMVERQLPIPAETVKALHHRFEEVGDQWMQLT
jgi:aryl-alcohol dehydrogenase-like predicted oxidoreductase